MIDFSVPYRQDPGVSLDEKLHKWTLDGRPAPGIGSILDHSSVRPVFEGDMSRGIKIHLGIQWSTLPDFDFDEFKRLYPDCAGPVESGRRAIDHFKVRPGWVEIKVCHRRLWFCTAIDAIGLLDDRVAVINWKSGAEAEWHAIQSAGEHMAFTGDDYHDFEMRTARVGVYLAEDGSFDPSRQVRVHDKPGDFRIFEAACEISEWKQFHGYARPAAKFKPRPKEERAVVASESALFTGEAGGDGEGGLFG